MTLLLLAYKSLKSRAVTTSLTIFSIALSVMLLVGVDRVRQGTQAGFSGTLSQTDLVVGARGGSLPLLLYSVFHIGTGTNDISYASYQHFRDHPAVQWTIPISLGDSHHGFRVVATDDNFYEHYRFRRDHSIQFASGIRPEGIFDAVLGSEVAASLHYELGQKIVLSHGLERTSLQNHEDKPFTVVGILARTSTPVDRAIYITLYGDEAMHIDWKDGTAPAPGEEIPASKIRKEDLHIDQISAFLLRTKSRVSTLLLQREINTYKGEPLTAIIPAYTLQDLWSVLGYADVALSIVSASVLVVGLLAMLIALYTALNERRREVAVLRAIGLHARQIFTLFVMESALISAAGTAVGLTAIYLLLWLFHTPVETRFGIPLAMVGVSQRVILYSFGVIFAGVLLGCIPAMRAYRNGLIDGLNAH
ncbi:ABC transporter permease [Edaphobacter modestus]|uniref:Putative ABC transport system permease protein n=1 Tax=Edaphobacter modestus TaxID=388466 RepID=A0A4Q7YQG5_9BACT|nr:FtsX-like permease family protein [Edaphobacter modestus]RZU39019.1 putative ABC transport system permease protein [Edaphobacter modestus]